MPRFLLVRGRQGVLVPNPHALDASPMRVAGQRPLVGAKPGPLHTLFEPCDEVLLDSPDLLSAVAADPDAAVPVAEQVAAVDLRLAYRRALLPLAGRHLIAPVPAAVRSRPIATASGSSSSSPRA